MSRRSRKYITIIGHRFLRVDFWRWVICFVVFLSIIAASWVTFLLFSAERRKESKAMQNQTKVAVVKEVTTVIGPTQPSRLDLFVDKQREAIGSVGDEGLVVSGEITQDGEVREFQDHWSPPNKMKRVFLTDGEVTEVLTYDGKQFWAVSPEGKVDMTDTPQAQLFAIEASLYDPLANYTEERRHYRLLFDEDFNGRPNKVIGYRFPGKVEIRYFFDSKKLFEVRRLAWLVGEKNGQRDIRFEGHREIAGRTLPGTISFISKGEVIQTIKIENAIPRKAMSDSTFLPLLSLND